MGKQVNKGILSALQQKYVDEIGNNLCLMDDLLWDMQQHALIMGYDMKLIDELQKACARMWIKFRGIYRIHDKQIERLDKK